ncbi:MAG: hypothetical protein U1E45_22440 [Geminicoccaceae bacterium]
MSDQEEVQAAFRAELSKRLRGSLGPNERVVLSLTRLPGLSTVEGARDSARILRAIASLLDAAGAPESMGQQFVDNLVAAAIGSRLRRPVEPWGGAETLDLLVEMQARQAGVDDPEKIRRALEKYIDRQVAADEPATPRKGVSALFGRRPRS